SVHRRRGPHQQFWMPATLPTYRLRYEVRLQLADVQPRFGEKLVQKYETLPLKHSGEPPQQFGPHRYELARESGWLQYERLAAAVRSYFSTVQLPPAQPGRALVHPRSHHGARRRISPLPERRT